MKKAVLSLLAFALLCLSGCTSNTPQANLNTPPSNSSVSLSKINLDGEVFELKYSASNKNPPSHIPSNINEYYLPQEKYSDWTELIGVFYYPNSPDPAAHALRVKNSLPKGSLQNMFIEQSTGKSFIVFIAGGADKSGLKDVEHSIFRYEKSPKVGTVAFQYVNRRFFKTDQELKDALQYFEKNNMKWLEATLATPIPQLVERNIDLGN